MKEYYVSLWVYRFNKDCILTSFLIKYHKVFKDNVSGFLNACSDEAMRRIIDSTSAQVISWIEVKER